MLDANVEAEVVAHLRGMSTVKVLPLPEGNPSDDQIWRAAQRSPAVIVSVDGSDFWNDRRFALQECPGLVVLVGKTAQAHWQAVQHALHKGRLLEHFQRYATFRDTKIKVTAAGQIHAKVFIGGEIVCMRG